MSNKMSETIERHHARNMRRVSKKISKTVVWNNLEFESGRALARHLKMSSPNNVYNYIKKKMNLKGHVPYYGKL